MIQMQSYSEQNNNQINLLPNQKTLLTVDLINEMESKIQQEEALKRVIEQETQQITIQMQEAEFVKYLGNKVNQCKKDLNTINDNLIIYSKMTKLSYFHVLIMAFKLANSLYILIYLLYLILSLQKLNNYCLHYVQYDQYHIRNDAVKSVDISKCQKNISSTPSFILIFLYCICSIYLIHKVFYLVNQVRYLILIWRLNYIDRVRKYDILFSDYFASNFEFILSGFFIQDINITFGDNEQCYWVSDVPILLSVSSFYNFGLSSILLIYIFCSKKHTSTFKYPILLSFLALLGGLYRLLVQIYQLFVELFTKATFVKIFYAATTSAFLFGVGYYTYLVVPVMFAYGNMFFIVHYYIFYILLLLQTVLFYDGINFYQQIDFLTCVFQIIELKEYLHEKLNETNIEDNHLIEKIQQIKQNRYSGKWEEFTRITQKLMKIREKLLQLEKTKPKDKQYFMSTLSLIRAFRRYDNFQNSLLNVVTKIYFQKNILDYDTKLAKCEDQQNLISEGNQQQQILPILLDNKD